MTSIKEILFISLIITAIGGAIIYETVKSVNYIKNQVLQVNSQHTKSKN